jgi:TolB-like protein
MLLEHPGLVVTREELRRHLWPEGTFVDFDHCINAAVKRLRAALKDHAKTPRFLETLPGIGYRLSAPVENIDASHPAPSPDAVATIARVSVLPFAVLSESNDPIFFTSRISDAIVSCLQRRCRDRLIALGPQSRAMAPPDPSTIPEQHRGMPSADYVVTGSVRAQHCEVRTAAALVDAQQGTHLWAGTYEPKIAKGSLFLQPDVADAIAESAARTLLVPRYPRPVELPEARRPVEGRHVA